MIIHRLSSSSLNFIFGSRKLFVCQVVSVSVSYETGGFLLPKGPLGATNGAKFSYQTGVACVTCK